MTSSEAYNQIALLLQPDSEPILTTIEVSGLVSLSARADNYNRAPSNSDWTPTYDIYAGVTFGWKIKAAKVAGSYQFKDDTLELHREQVIEQCLKMASEFSKMTVNSVSAESYREAALRRAGLLDTTILEEYEYAFDTYF